MINLTGDATADANARTFMWINPDPSITPDTNTADVKRNTNLSTGFNKVAIEFGGEDVMALGYDEIRLGTSFEEVSSPLVSSDYLVRESFEYPVGTSLDSLAGSSINGWGGSWDLYDGAKGASVVADTGFDAASLNYPVPSTGKHLVGVNVNGWDTHRYVRALAKLWPDEPGKVYWFSMLMQIKNDPSTSTWLGVKLGTDPPTAEFPIMFGKGYGMNVFKLRLKMGLLIHGILCTLTEIIMKC